MFRKLFIAFVICFALSIVWAQVDDKMGELHDEVSQKGKVIHARAILQSARMDVVRYNLEFTDIVNSGSFDKVDKQIKQALLTGWNVIKDAEQGFEDPNLAKLLDWSPSQ